MKPTRIDTWTKVGSTYASKKALRPSVRTAAMFENQLSQMAKQKHKSKKLPLIENLTSSDFESRIIQTPRILFFDLETAPNTGYTWGKWEQNVLGFVDQVYLLSVAYKWLGEKKTHVMSLPEYVGYEPGKADDKNMVRDLWNLFNEADIIIAHNGDAFDVKVANARFVVNGFPPPTFYRTIDTKKIAKRAFRFNSNSLNDLGMTLGLGRKTQHTGFDMWLGCLKGEQKSWAMMCKYNKQDVVLLEQVYLAMRAWAPSHPNMNVIMNTDGRCGKCGSSDVVRRGSVWTNMSRAQRFFCNSCQGYSQGKYTKIASTRSS